MKIGITGAFGFLGSNLTAYLIKNNQKDTIVAFSLKTRYNPVFDNKKVTIRELDICNYEDVLKKTKDIDILFHFAGKVSYRKKDAEQLWKINVLGTRNIFRASLNNRLKKIIYVSSINVLGSPVSATAMADEENNVYDQKSDNPNIISSSSMAHQLVDLSLAGDYSFLKKLKVPYFDSKLAGYELAKTFADHYNLPLVTVFPGTVVGPGDIHKDISELIERVYTNRILFTFSGGTSFVDVRDCAEGIYNSMEKGIVGQSYIISGKDEDNLTYKEFMIQVANTAEKESGKTIRKRFLVVPHSIARFVSLATECISPNTKLGSALAHSGKMVHRFTSRKALRDLNYLPKYNLSDSIRDCYQFMEIKTKKTSK